MKKGTQLGPYRVESLLGAGGMGEVYLATDTRLDRSVAIKVMPSHLSSNPALRERFEREARTISSLSHPHICALFDVGRHDGSDYLVMEYLEGETLAERLARGPLPRDQTIRIGGEIAGALDRAHKQGVIHRDLKPGNVMLTKSGVKLLDFGLAKLAISADRDQNSPTSLATAQKPLTEQGAILGTYQYMSPEQLEGRDADARSDIFALGCVLYEMATGKRAFNASSKASLIAAILDRDPQPMSEIAPMTPPPLERLVRACMAKDPEERMQTAHDVALELRWIGESSSMSEAPAIRRRKIVTAWIVASILGAIAITATALYLRERARPMQAFDLQFVPQGDDYYDDGVISPDGTMVAYVNYRPAEAAVMVRHLDEPRARKLAVVHSTYMPAWSSDSQWIAYPDSGKLMKVRAAGGEPQVICKTATAYGIAWNAGGTILFTPHYGTTGMFKVPASGGEPVEFTKLDAARGERAHVWPTFLPDDKHFLFVIFFNGDHRNEIAVGSLDGGKPKTVMIADALVGYSKPYVLFNRDGAIYAQKFDAGSFTVSGEAQSVIENRPYDEANSNARANVSRNGVIAYRPYFPSTTQHAVYDRTGRPITTLWTDLSSVAMSLAADGKQGAFQKFNPEKGAPDVYYADLARRISTRLTRDHGSDSQPVISADGQQVIFASDRAGMFDLYVKATDGSTPEHMLWHDPFDKRAESLSPDGKFLLADHWTPTTRGDIWIVPMSGEKPTPFVATEEQEGDPRFSPDGKWVAYSVGPRNYSEVYIKPFPTGRAIRISIDGGDAPTWNPNGREIVYVHGDRQVMSVAIDLRGTVADIKPPVHLFDNRSDATRPKFTPDGNLLIESDLPGTETRPGIGINTAWRQKLKD